jgi:hypothetical protein
MPQGILSSFFYKFADTILKKYSSTIATIFTALLSWLMFAHPLTMNFALGVSIVFVSMHQFFTFGDKKDQKKAGIVYSPSMDHIRVANGGSPAAAVAVTAAAAADGVDEVVKYSDDGTIPVNLYPEKQPLLPR